MMNGLKVSMDFVANEEDVARMLLRMKPVEIAQKRIVEMNLHASMNYSG